MAILDLPVVMDCGGVVHEIQARMVRQDLPRCDTALQGPLRRLSLGDVIYTRKQPCWSCFRNGWPVDAVE